MCTSFGSNLNKLLPPPLFLNRVLRFWRMLVLVDYVNILDSRRESHGLRRHTVLFVNKQTVRFEVLALVTEIYYSFLGCYAVWCSNNSRACWENLSPSCRNYEFAWRLYMASYAGGSAICEKCDQHSVYFKIIAVGLQSVVQQHVRHVILCAT